MLDKIISGGQSGADTGGLMAGHTLGIETGGTAPPNYQTETGPSPFLLKHYNLIEGESDPRVYPKRTRRNVADSDGTLLVGNTTSPGSKLTLRFCMELGRPFIINPTSPSLRRWLIAYNIKTLNVAGNRESKSPGIAEKTFQLIVTAVLEET